MLKINFDHTQSDVLKAFGFDGPEQANEITQDETNPDCMKMRFAAAIFNGDALSVLTLWALSLKPDLTEATLRTTTSESFETLFDKLDDSFFVEVNRLIDMFKISDLTNEELALSIEASMMEGINDK